MNDHIHDLNFLVYYPEATQQQIKHQIPFSIALPMSHNQFSLPSLSMTQRPHKNKSMIKFMISISQPMTQTQFSLIWLACCANPTRSRRFACRQIHTSARLRGRNSAYTRTHTKPGYIPGFTGTKISYAAIQLAWTDMFNPDAHIIMQDDFLSTWHCYSHDESIITQSWSKQSGDKLSKQLILL